MKLPLIASKIHKYLALIIGIQLVFWVISGAFFAIVPLSKVHSDHLVKEIDPKPILVQDFSAVTQIISKSKGFDKFELQNSNRGSVLLGYRGKNPIAFDAKTGAQLAAINTDEAVTIANSVLLKPRSLNTAKLIYAHNIEYQGELPAFLIKYSDGFTLYVGANSGEVRARRSSLWRVYDKLWSLHIMDWVNHDNFNNPFIRIVAVLAIILVLAGIALIPYRFRWRSSKPPKKIN